MKKILSAVMAVVLLLTGVIASSAAENSDKQLQFNKDGKFKIMILADPQDGYPIREDFIYLLNEALDKAEPDLVVFLGDNVMGADEWTLEKYKMGFDQMLTPIVEREIPFTLVFGNHDEESSPGLTKEQILEIYQSFDGCLAYDAVPELHGCGTHNLPILSSDGTHTAFNLWMMDSGSYAYTEKTGYHYDCVRRNQIEWYEQTSKALEEENGAPVPSFMFQHIVPADVAEQVMVTLPFHHKKYLTDYNLENGKSLSFLPNVFGFKSGFVGEIPCSSTENEGQMDSLAQRGDVLALFFGHDHVNSYCANVKGIDAINVPGCTYESYYSFILHGIMTVTLDEKDLGTYRTDMIYANDLALEKGSKLPEMEKSMGYYIASEFVRILVKVLLTPLKQLTNIVGEILY